MIPVFKSADKLNAGNYRPIALRSVSPKIMEHIIAKHIHCFLDEHKLLYNKEHGFRSGLSSVTQLVELRHDITSALNNKEQID